MLQPHAEPTVLAVTDVSSASLVPSLKTRGRNIIAVVGDGMEFLEDAPREEQVSCSNLIEKAAALLLSASHVLVTCGAGISKDAGLDTFEDFKDGYRDLCDPASFAKDPDLCSSFWKDLSEKYSRAELHDGYLALERLLGKGDGGLLPNLESTWCYTSNVDGMMRRLSCFDEGEKVCEIHGNANNWVCSLAMGKSDDQVRIGKVWKDWNEKVEKSNCGASPSSCAARTTDCGSFCGCGLPRRPDVLFFNDTDAVVLSRINEARDKYQQWEALMEQDVAKGSKTMVILEVGCGTAVPSVRNESYEVLRDVRNLGGKSFLVRINVKDEGHVDGVDTENTFGDSILSIRGKASSALKQILDEILLRRGEA